jgi:vitamin B12 transporter
MRTLFLAAITLTLSAFVFGQHTSTIKGRVTDKQGQPVPGATVTASMVDHSPRVSGVTDAQGRYSIEVVPWAIYTVVVTIVRDGRIEDAASAPGSLTIEPGGIREINFIVSVAAGIFETVTISAGEVQPIEQVSKTIDVIAGQEMRERADFALVETLRTIPGFRVQQLGGFGKTASVKTRGLRNQDTAVLIDGIRFRDPAAITGDASPFLSDLTLTSVGEVEILRGSGSSLYGTNAIGGVVDLQTPTARAGTHGQIAGAVGGLGLGRFRGLVSHGWDRVGIGVGISRTVYTKGIDGQDDAHNTNFQPRVDLKWPNTFVSGRIFFSDADVRLNVNPDTLGVLPASNATIIDARPGVNFVPDANDPDSLQKSRFLSGQLSVTQIVNGNVTLGGHYQGLSTRRRNTDGPLGPGFQSVFTSIFEGRIDTANGHLTWRPAGTNRNTMTAGYEWERERFLNEGGTPNASDAFWTRAGQRSHTFYIQDRASLVDDRLQLAGGFRVQGFRSRTPGFSSTNAPYSGLRLDNPPNAYTFDGAASYFFRSTGTKLRAHVGSGYRVPSLYERFGTFFSTFGPPAFVALGDPLLKPERSAAFDMGLEQYAAEERVRLSATYFYTKLTDTIGFGNVVPAIGTTPRPFGGYENQEGGIARGGEFSIRAKPRNCLEIFSSYTFTNSDQRMPQVAGSGVTRSLGIPDHQFTLVATQRYKRAWVNFDLLATSSYLAPIFSSSTFNTYIYRFRGNRRGDVTTGYTFAFRGERVTLRLYGTIENVFGNEYYENGFRTIRRTGRIGATFAF